MKLRKSLAAAMIAGAALVAVAGCSGSDSASDTVASATSKVTEATSQAAAAIAGLTNSDAQDNLRKAVDPNTSSDELEKVVDTSNPVTKTAIQAYAKGASAAGYGPDVYTVTEVKKTGDNAADASVEVKSPHTSNPANITLSYVKVDGEWKLSGNAVTQLTSMMGQHGG